MAVDTGIIKIYDLDNDGAPLMCHKIDAREFLAHPSGRWSASPKEHKNSVATSDGTETGEDSGQAIRLKNLHYKTLQSMAEKAGIDGAGSMKKAELVDALMEEETV